MNPNHHRIRAWIMTGAAAVGLAVGAAGVATAATSGSSNASTPSSSSAAAPSATAPNPETLTHGPGETLLTGIVAQQVSAAALKAVPGGTIIRVETDSAGSPYEAHVKKTDGTDVTVKVDSSFTVTSIEDGFGVGPNGGAHPGRTRAVPSRPTPPRRAWPWVPGPRG